MSMHVFCRLMRDPFTEVEHLDLVHTPDEVSLAVALSTGIQRRLAVLGESSEALPRMGHAGVRRTPNTLSPERPAKGTGTSGGPLRGVARNRPILPS